MIRSNQEESWWVERDVTLPRALSVGWFRELYPHTRTLDSKPIMMTTLINLLEINLQGLPLRKRLQNLLKAEELLGMREEIIYF